MHLTVVVIAICAVIFPASVYGHGRMMDPVNRASRWRLRGQFPGSPVDYDDNGLYCGGKSVQWGKHGGKCGVCGDEYGIKNPKFAYPGAFAKNPPIVKTYQEGQQIDVQVEITTNHKGYFEFHLAPLVKQPITQDELDKIVLKTTKGNTKWKLPPGNKWFTIPLQLPKDFTCQHCVLQWQYKAGNDWDKSTPETFVNCADIAILPPGVNPKPPQPPRPTQRPRPQLPQPSKSSGKTCHALPNDMRPGMDEWCRRNCAVGYCPASHCVCD